MEKLGFRPYPGTLNVEISPGSVKALEALEKENGIGLISPDPTFCNAKAFPVSMGGVTGAIVIPEEKVRVHGKSIVEVMAHLRLKDALGAEDGDFVTLVVENPKSQKRED
jgi:CTP-dependent riboflavin kinase